MSVTFNDEKQNQTLQDLRKDEEEQLVKIFSDKYNLPYVDLRGLAPEPDAMLLVSLEDGKRANLAPFKLVGKKLYVAALSPENNELREVLEPLEQKGYQLLLFLASHASLAHVYDRYADLQKFSNVESGMFELTPEKMSRLMATFSTVDELRGVFETLTHSQVLYKTTRIMELMVAGALKFSASDIHIEPEEDKVRLRYRLNGVLEDISFFDFDSLKSIESRIKLLSGLKLSTTASAQDGRFSINLGDVEVDMRVSVVPGNYGQSFVMRILDPRNTVSDLKKIAFPEKLREEVEKALAKPNGVILTTGPTGSGKTTTLYAFLRRTYSTETKIITIEDPVEYHLEGLTQTQVDPKKGYTFLSGLRAALRQDPDVIMVGEIRDEDTAKVAINAALTGHLVFSTLHTNNAAGTIPRLIDLGINPKILADALSLAIAQRLVRKLCPDCKQQYLSNEKETRIITTILGVMKTDGKGESMLGHVPDVGYTLYHPVGCLQCDGTGYKGRIGVFEGVVMTSEVEKILITSPSEREIVAASKNQGIPTLREDAILKTLEGITSFEEVSRVVDLYND